jgi:translation initiation factor 1
LPKNPYCSKILNFRFKNMNKSNDWKDRLGVVYSTRQDYNYEENSSKQEDTLPPEKQNLRIQLSTKHRKGKTATLITGFVGRTEDLQALEKDLKSKCATGGTCKEGEIIIQGDFREKISIYLRSKNFKVRT